jgi:hypothetical protein
MAKKKAKTINELKCEFELDHAEQLFGIIEEISFQCPRIDEFIEDLEGFERHLDKLSSLSDHNDNDINVPYIEREMDILHAYLPGIKSQFEELRKSYGNLREWGDAWKSLAKKLFEDIPYNNKYLDKKFKNKNIEDE